jgi:hypothetical protein
VSTQLAKETGMSKGRGRTEPVRSAFAERDSFANCIEAIARQADLLADAIQGRMERYGAAGEAWAMTDIAFKVRDELNAIADQVRSRN